MYSLFACSSVSSVNTQQPGVQWSTRCWVLTSCGRVLHCRSSSALASTSCSLEVVVLADAVCICVCIAGYQAVPGGDHQVDQSAWSVSTVQGAGRQVPHGSQVWRDPSHRALPQLQGKRREANVLRLTHHCASSKSRGKWTTEKSQSLTQTQWDKIQNDPLPSSWRLKRSSSSCNSDASWRSQTSSAASLSMEPATLHTIQYRTCDCRSNLKIKIL